MYRKEGSLPRNGWVRDGWGVASGENEGLGGDYPVVLSLTVKFAMPILNRNLAAVSSVLNSRISRLVVSNGLPSATTMYPSAMTA